MDLVNKPGCQVIVPKRIVRCCSLLLLFMRCCIHNKNANGASLGDAGCSFLALNLIRKTIGSTTEAESWNRKSNSTLCVKSGFRPSP
ncbi:hypothetical protein HUJ05_000358 [Dendroctonus ponderosae]|nr:hypothetical protein HUJ05_000358 [Dendroctonus ponderosae]